MQDTAAPVCGSMQAHDCFSRPDVHLVNTGPGTIFMQSTNVGRVRQSLLTERALVRGGAVEVFKGAAMVAVMVAVLFAFFEV